MEAKVLEFVAHEGEISDSEEFCRRFDPALVHSDLIGCLRSLEACEMITLEVLICAAPDTSLAGFSY